MVISMPTKPETPFENLIETFLDHEKPLHAGYFYRLSDLDEAELTELGKFWMDIPTWRRVAIMEDVEELGDMDFTLSFEALARFCMQDSEPKVRELAVRTLWDYELPDLIPTYLDMIESDQNVNVRAVVATALSKYIYLGEIEELSQKALRSVEDKLIEIYNGKDTLLVRRRALEALGFSSRVEVPDMINEAYYSGDNDWLVSALFAMGCSANKIWKSKVLDMLENDFEDVLVEAIRAAGELEISEASASLYELLNHEVEDIRKAAIWSLSQIGGERIGEFLEDLYDQTEDPEELEWLESVLENLAFTEDLHMFELLDFDDDDPIGYDMLDLIDDEDTPFDQDHQS